LNRIFWLLERNQLVSAFAIKNNNRKWRGAAATGVRIDAEIEAYRRSLVHKYSATGSFLHQSDIY